MTTYENEERTLSSTFFASANKYDKVSIEL